MVNVSDWPYLRGIAFSGDLPADLSRFLTANGKPKTAEHCFAVARKSEELTGRYEMDPAPAVAAALLHDVSAVLKPRDMMDYAIAHRWEIDEAEREYPSLLHQRLSAVFTRDVFGVEDPRVLSAILCHTTLKENPSEYDMVLFLADKLAWDQPGMPPFFEVVSDALTHSLRHASRVYIEYALDNGMIRCPHHWLMEAKAWLSRRV